MRRRSYRRALPILGVVTLLLTWTGCTTPESGDRTTLHVLVTNDDGVHAPGIDRLVTTLDALPDVEVRVIAPAENKSGTGDSRLNRAAIGTPSRTASGYAAIAVHGYPADTVLFAHRNGVLRRIDVVVSGVNWGENVGPTVAYSGTIGAARTAVRLGLPAVAISQGDGDPPDFAAGADAAARWVQLHREELLQRTAPVVVTNINVPTCPTAPPPALRGVPVATEAAGARAVQCGSTTPLPFADDVEAFLSGHATVSTFDSDLRPVADVQTAVPLVGQGEKPQVSFGGHAGRDQVL
jgi:5'-nucleotidase